MTPLLVYFTFSKNRKEVIIKFKVKVKRTLREDLREMKRALITPI